MNINSKIQPQAIQIPTQVQGQKEETAAIVQGAIEPRAVESNEKPAPTKNASEQLAQRKEVNNTSNELTYDSRGVKKQDAQESSVELVV